MKNPFENYFNDIEKRIHEVYDLAKEARKKGLDPKDIVEIPLALNLAQRVLALVGTMYPQIINDDIEKRIKELEKEYGFLDPAVCLKIAEEIAKEKFCKFRSFEEAMDAGIRIAFGYLTLGVVAAPLEGYTHFTVKKTREGKDYIAAYYSGPIGGAGRSAASISLLIVDYLRELFGFSKYDPTEEEIKRMITEIYDRHTRITNLQYLPSEKEIEFLVRNIPIQIDGDPTEEREVSNFKDLPRIATNRIRSGACLILGEGIAQKAPKTLKALNKLRKDGFKLKDWDFLEKFVDFQRKMAETKKVEKASGTYIQDAVAGRPILGHPSRSGAFRLRYGRGRTSGYSATSISPITMLALEEFIGIGTQLKLEKPTKASSMSSCDSIDGPILLLNDGSVTQPRTEEDFRKIKKNVKRILYLGDILISYGDFYNRNYPLLPPGYCPEWWFVELEEALKSKPNTEIEKIKPKHWNEKITLDNAIKISNISDVSLHPDFIFFWSQINNEELLSLLNWFIEGKIVENKLLLPYESINKEKYRSAKEALEIIGAEHNVGVSDVLLDKEVWKTIFSNFSSDDINFKDDLKKMIEKLNNFQGTVL
jgi:DNA polymerase II large subunit